MNLPLFMLLKSAWQRTSKVNKCFSALFSSKTEPNSKLIDDDLLRILRLVLAFCFNSLFTIQSNPYDDKMQINHV